METYKLEVYNNFCSVTEESYRGTIMGLHTVLYREDVNTGERKGVTEE